MMMRNISQAKAEFSSLVEAVLQGKQVIIGKAGKPVARLVPYSGTTAPRRPGALKGKIKMAPDFDVLPDELKEPFGADQ
jgi:prevent-host-death family protein